MVSRKRLIFPPFDRPAPEFALPGLSNQSGGLAYTGISIFCNTSSISKQPTACRSGGIA